MVQQKYGRDILLGYILADILKLRIVDWHQLVPGVPQI